MSEALQTSAPETSKDLRSATFSQALAAGHTRYDWLASPTTSSCGREAALANHSAAPGKAEELTIRDIFGRPSDGSSPSAGLQSSLESRLRARLDEAGAPEYAMTSKSWAMELGPAIYARRASTPRTSGKDSGGEPPTLEQMLDGWQTAQASDPEGGVMKMTGEFSESKGKYKLRDWRHLAGWPNTPQAIDACGEGRPPRLKKDMPRDPNLTGSYRGDLKDWAVLAGWPTASVRDQKGGYNGGRIRNGKQPTDTLDVTAMLSGWPTSQASDPVEGARTAPESRQACLGRDVPLTGWPTLGETASTGLAVTESFVACQQRLSEIEKPRLNPFFSLWLMGYPTAWGIAGLISGLLKKNSKKLDGLRQQNSRSQDAQTLDVFL